MIFNHVKIIIVMMMTFIINCIELLYTNFCDQPFCCYTTSTSKLALVSDCSFYQYWWHFIFKKKSVAHMINKCRGTFEQRTHWDSHYMLLREDTSHTGHCSAVYAVSS